MKKKPASKRATKHPATERPGTERPTTKRPTTKRRANEHPATERPATELKPAAKKAKSCGKVETSRHAGAALLDVIELGGGCAADLVEALLDPGVDHDEVSVLAAAFRAAKRRQAEEGRKKPKARSAARIHSAELMSVVALAGGSAAGVVDALLEHGSAVRDLQLLRAALTHEPPVPVPVPESEAAQGAQATGVVEEPQLDAAGKSCEVCDSRPCAAGDKTWCKRCSAMVKRLQKRSGGVCGWEHVRGAFSDLGSGAKLSAIRRRAQELAGDVHPAAEQCAVNGAPAVCAATAVPAAASREAPEDAEGEVLEDAAASGISRSAASRAARGADSHASMLHPKEEPVELEHGAWANPQHRRSAAEQRSARSLGAALPPAASPATTGTPPGRGRAVAAEAAAAGAVVVTPPPLQLQNGALPAVGGLAPVACEPPSRQTALKCTVCCHRSRCQGKVACGTCAEWLAEIQGPGSLAVLRDAFRVHGADASRHTVLSYARLRLAGARGASGAAGA